MTMPLQAIEAAVTAAVAEATAQAVHKTKQEVEAAQAQAAAAQADLRAAEDAQQVVQLTNHVEVLQQELLLTNKKLQVAAASLRYACSFTLSSQTLNICTTMREVIQSSAAVFSILQLWSAEVSLLGSGVTVTLRRNWI